MRCTRTNKGASTVVLVLFLSLFAILPLGLLAFEIARFMLIEAELQHITEAAALSGTADAASEPEYNTNTGTAIPAATRQQNAMNVAVATFCANTVLATSFSTTTNPNVVVNFNSNGAGGPVAPPSGQPGAYAAWIYIALKDNSGTYVATGSSAATMELHSYFGCQPIFASSVFPIAGTYVATAVCTGGLPQIDLVLCFDLSGSMDDSTKVYYVRRYWDATNQKTNYPTCNATADTIYNLENLANMPNPNGLSAPAPTSGTPSGTSLNVVPPEKLSWGKYYTYTFSEDTTSTTLNMLRANHSPGFAIAPGTGLLSEQALPPGNYDPSNPSDLTYQPAGKPVAFPSSNNLNSPPYTSYFTDLIDAGIVGQTTGGFTFDSIATAVEAARGNLESAAIFAQAVPGSHWSGAAVPGPGWYQAYWNFVMNDQNNGELPMSYARAAAVNFLQTMSISANSHFSLICFSNNAGSSQFGTFTDPTNNDTNNIDAFYPNGGQGVFPLPMVALNSSADNYTNSVNGLNGTTNLGIVYPPVGPLGGTNIADALASALNQLQTNSRPNARRAIVLFTDGVPDEGTVNEGPHNGTTYTNWPFYGSDTIATDASTANIPVYTIGLSQNAGITPIESSVLGDGKNGSGNGIAYISGNGATYSAVAGGNPQNLDQAFQSIARSLCVLQ
jgi:Flp pilus assembly protein TadG